MNVQPQIAAEQHARPLRIRRADAIAIAVPLAKPMLMAAETITHAENLVVRLEAEDGLVGWGEATVAPTMTGDTLPGMVAALRRHLAPLIVGADVGERAELSRRCRQAIVHNGGAKAAVEIALLDLAGKHYGVPAVELIGGALRRSVANMWLLGNPDPAADIAEAKRKVAEGYTYFKLKVGVKRVEAEIETALQVRAALGPDVLLCADANTGWDARTAKAYMRGVEGAGLLYLEQPLPSDQLEAMGALNRLGMMPISGDECVGGSGDILALGQSGVVGGVNLKVIKTKGITPLLAAAGLCQQLGLSVTLAVKVACTSLGGAATLAAACASPVLDWGVSLTQVYLGEDVVRDPLRLQNGRFILRDAPGLGVDVDEDAIRRYTVD
ncbi:MAG TPA: enolase C-terminal domain-like protein [Pseudolabrys sp.]|nr:enolase C-terminal domain-like protein [Pseudolabrys sp.]